MKHKAELLCNRDSVPCSEGGEEGNVNFPLRARRVSKEIDHFKKRDFDLVLCSVHVGQWGDQYTITCKALTFRTSALKSGFKSQSSLITWFLLDLKEDSGFYFKIKPTALYWIFFF